MRNQPTDLLETGGILSVNLFIFCGDPDDDYIDFNGNNGGDNNF